MRNIYENRHSGNVTPGTTSSTATTATSTGGSNGSSNKYSLKKKLVVGALALATVTCAAKLYNNFSHTHSNQLNSQTTTNQVQPSSTTPVVNSTIINNTTINNPIISNNASAVNTSSTGPNVHPNFLNFPENEVYRKVTFSKLSDLLPSSGNTNQNFLNFPSNTYSSGNQTRTLDSTSTTNTTLSPAESGETLFVENIFGELLYTMDYTCKGMPLETDMRNFDTTFNGNTYKLGIDGKMPEAFMNEIASKCIPHENWRENSLDSLDKLNTYIPLPSDIYQSLEKCLSSSEFFITSVGCGKAVMDDLISNNQSSTSSQSYSFNWKNNVLDDLDSLHADEKLEDHIYTADKICLDAASSINEFTECKGIYGKFVNENPFSFEICEGSRHTIKNHDYNTKIDEVSGDHILLLNDGVESIYRGFSEEKKGECKLTKFGIPELKRLNATMQNKKLSGYEEINKNIDSLYVYIKEFSN